MSAIVQDAPREVLPEARPREHPSDDDDRRERRAPEPPRREHVPLRYVLGAALLLALVTVSIVARRWQSARAWPEGLIQVNGRIEGDRITLASKFAGRVVALRAREGDAVRKGQVLVQVDDAQTRAKLSQAEANLQAAIAQERGAGESVTLTDETTDAQVLAAQGLVHQAESGVAAAKVDVSRAEAAVTLARATARSTEASFDTAAAAYTAAVANRRRANEGVAAAEAQVETARASALAAQAEVEAAQANAEKAARDARRFGTLLKQGAVSEQTADTYAAAEKSAQAQWQSARAQAAAAEAAVIARQSEVRAARQQLAVSEAAVQQAQAQMTASREQGAAAWAGVRQAEAQHQAAREIVLQTEARRQQAVGGLHQARTAPHQVAVSKTNQSQAQARIEQARAAVSELRSMLRDLSTVAPISGTVTMRLRDVGEVVAAGTPLLELVDLDRLYLKVYVPENQIGKVRLGLPARLHVDAFPDQPFEARVGYIASTAEFTPKEVQTPDERVKLVYAVKLYLRSNPSHRLTPGLPADAVIQWKEGTPWRKPRW